MAIRPEKIVLHLSFPHPVYGTFTPVKLEDHQFIDTQEEKDEALDIAKKRLEEWYSRNYPSLDTGQSYVAPPSNVCSSVMDTTITDTELEKELQVFSLFKKREDAEFYQKTSPFKYHIKVKDIINSLPYGKKD